MASKKATSKMDGGAERAKGRAKSRSAKSVRAANKTKRGIAFKQSGSYTFSNVGDDGTLYDGEGFASTAGVDGPMSPIERRAKRAIKSGLESRKSAPGPYKGWGGIYVPSYFDSKTWVGKKGKK